MHDIDFLSAFYEQPLTVFVHSGAESPAVMALDGRDMVLAFSQTTQLVEIMAAGSAFVEMRGDALISYCQEKNVALGFDFGLSHGRVLLPHDYDALLDIAKYKLPTVPTDQSFAPDYASPDPALVDTIGVLLRQLDSALDLYYLANNARPTVALAQGALGQSLAEFFALDEALKSYRGDAAVDIIVFKDSDNHFSEIRKQGYKFAPSATQRKVPILR